MQRIKLSFWGLLALLSMLWLAADPSILQWAGYFAFRAAMVQHSGLIAIGCMSIAMILALRPRWPETWLGGLDKMYRLHKWLGIGALAFAVAHWLWAQGTKWAVGWGWLERPQRGPRAALGTATTRSSNRSWTCVAARKRWANGHSMPSCC